MAEPFSLTRLEEHPLRLQLDGEFHARPPVALDGSHLVTHLVFKHRRGTTELERAHLERLVESPICRAVERSEGHLWMDLGSFKLRWELHTEFSGYSFIRPLAAGSAVSPQDTAYEAAPPEWLAGIPGRLLAATHVELRSVREVNPEQALTKATPSARSMVASKVADENAWVLTDFRLEGGFSRFLVLDAGMTPRQAGRTVQRLVEIDAYRMLALLGLKAAKEVGGWIYRAENELAALMDRIGQSATPDDEQKVLESLTRLAAEVEHSVARTTFRFGGSRAYHRLVSQRIAELREVRIRGFPTIEEFMQRRLAPAMATCEAMGRRQEELSARVVRNSQLLRARVDIALERQNQELLSQMNHRGRLQLRLQETVEGLSVVVLTYYGSMLVQYLAKGTKELHHGSPDVITAVAIPLIAGVMAWFTHRMRKRLAAEAGH